MVSHIKLHLLLTHLTNQNEKTRLMAGFKNLFQTNNQRSNPPSAMDNNAFDNYCGLIHGAKFWGFDL
ncbi:MAG: hypothetical protein HOH14_00030 [Gammaproteobacteria bacterium]|nr:hypothetical protein [Gammaproteobacteria bacterium]